MEYQIPKVAVDGIVRKDHTILLIKRKNDPFKGKWALPGGYVESGENTEDAVVREVFEETNLKTKIAQLFGVYSKPGRDPRGHTISIVYFLEIIAGQLEGKDDASEARFFDLYDLPELSFDHGQIIQDFIRRFE